MVDHVAKAFTAEAVHLDGDRYLDCEFMRAEMVFSGGELPIFTNCTFNSCLWRFEGAAERTLEHARFLTGFGNPFLTDSILRMVRS